MSDQKNIQNSIFKAIDAIAQRRIDQLELDKTIVGIIDSASSVTANGFKVYRIKYEGGFFYAFTRTKDEAYLPNTAVYIQVPRGDFSKDKFILGRVSDSIVSSATKSVVAAVANNYGIIGKNVLKLKNSSSNSFGVYSYHDIEEETSDKPNAIFHRYNLLYQYGEEESNKLSVVDQDLELYKEDATAIMIRADFMTKLTGEQKRQPSGEYGLIFSLVFKNLAADTEADTYGEIFDSFSEKIYIKTNNQDGEVKTTLKQKNDEIKKLLQGSNENIFGTDGQIDICLNKILEIQRVFSENYSSNYTSLMSQYLNLYIKMIEDLVRQNTLSEAKKIYNNWMKKELAEEKKTEKIVSYYVSSNNMVGNPFVFTKWTSQYEIFAIDLENFVRIDSIYLYQKGFISNSNKEDENPDILVKNLEFFAMKPLSDYNGVYQLGVEATSDTGLIFKKDSSDSVDSIVVEAKFTRELYENLTNNSQTTIYWFKQNKDVISPAQSNYHIYAGPGWEKISNNYSSKLKIQIEDAPAYKNYFRCVAVYEGEETPIILRNDFIVYNEEGKNFILTSDLGEDFAFDAGSPLLTVYEENVETKDLKELTDSSHYQLTWIVIDGNNQSTVLQKIKTEKESEQQYISSNPLNDKLMNSITYYNGDNELENGIKDVHKASRIKYPMINVATASTVTFEVIIGYKSDISSNSFSTIGKATLTLKNHKATNLKAYRLVIENGNQVFQYDEYGNAPDSGKIKDPQEILPLTAKIFAPNNLEVTNQNFKVKWFFPIGESMILQGNDVWQRDPATNNVNMVQGQKVDFTIDKLYNYNAFDNQIICQAILVTDDLAPEDQIFTQATTFNFVKVGNNGTNGTDMVAKIEPVNNHSLYIEQPPTIITYEDKEEKYAFFNTKYEISQSQPLTSKENGFFKAILFQKTEEVVLNESNIRWNIAGNTSTANSNSKYIDIIQDYNLSFNCKKQDGYRQHILKAEIRYKSGNENSDNDYKSYYAFYALPTIEYINKPSSIAKNRIGINVKTYLKDVLYNNDGRNPLYSHNQGLELINLPENYFIEWKACGGYIKNENKPCFSLLTNKDGKEAKTTCYSVNENLITNKNGEKEISIIDEWRNTNKDKSEKEKTTLEKWLINKKIKLSGTDETINFLNNKVYILPNDEYSGNVTNNYIEAIVYEIKGKYNSYTKQKIATVYAPINMTLNTFGLASVNAWDGNSITLDNERGAILAPQIAAGKKNDNNQFTGVAMGIAEDYSAGKEEHIIGLFGYSGGLRSFFLDSETGNATFGLPSIKDSNGKETEYSRYWDADQKKYIEVKNYNEGQIKLIPGGISVIGGWRLGRQSLYYTMNKSKNKNGYYDYSGEIGTGYTDDYGSHHLKDIRPEDQGILLSADPPYISIKSKEITEEQSDKNSQIKKGDSVEIQLDPENIESLAIFRHYMEGKKEIREQLSGLNNKGQLVANQMIQKPAKNEEEQSTKTSLGIENFTVFKNRHIGLNLGLTQSNSISLNNDDTDPFFRVSLAMTGQDKKLSINKTSQIYITAGVNGENYYARPISIHGKQIILYAEHSNPNNNYFSFTDANIKISADEFSTQIGPTTKLVLSKELGSLSLSQDDYDNTLSTASGLRIHIGGTSSYNQPFALYSRKQYFETKTGNIYFNSAENFQVESKKAVYIQSLDNNIILTRNVMKIKTDKQGNIEKDNQGNIIKEKKRGSIINIGEQNILILAGEDDKNTFNITSNASDNNSKTYLKSTSEINIDSSNDRLVLSSVQKENALGGSTESANALVLKTINSTDREKLVTKLMLNPRSTNNNAQSNLFYLDIGKDSKGKNLGHIEYGTLLLNGELRNRLYVGGSLEVAGGLKVKNGYLGGTAGVNSSSQALRIDASNEKPGTSYGVIKSDYFLATGANESPGHKYAFAKRETVEVSAHSNYDGGTDYKCSASGYNLYDLIQGCLTAAANATATAMNVQQNLNNFINNTYNEHTHTFSASGTTSITFTKADTVNNTKLTGRGSEATFKTAKLGDVFTGNIEYDITNENLTPSQIFNYNRLPNKNVGIVWSNLDVEGKEDITKSKAWSVSGTTSGPA